MEQVACSYLLQERRKWTPSVMQSPVDPMDTPPLGRHSPPLTHNLSVISYHPLPFLHPSPKKSTLSSLESLTTLHFMRDTLMTSPVLFSEKLHNSHFPIMHVYLQG